MKNQTQSKNTRDGSLNDNTDTYDDSIHPGIIRDRLLSKVIKDPSTKCWVWAGAKYKNGYGMFSYRGKTTCAHRFSYEVFIGPIPKGHEIHHLCKTRACINPEHLETLTRQEHMKKDEIDIGAWQSSKTHCPHGHEYTEDNLKATKTGYRVCLICHRKSGREYMRQKRAKNAL